jgi:hypothetical protein
LWSSSGKDPEAVEFFRQMLQSVKDFFHL